MLLFVEDESFRENTRSTGDFAPARVEEETKHPAFVPERVDASRWAIPSERWHRARPRAITSATTKTRRCFGRAPARDRTPRCG